MKVLSIKQPWAWLIIHGGKNIENRNWNTKFRGRFLVHAAKEIDQQAVNKYADILPDTLMVGGIVGSVELTDVCNGPWDMQSHKWFQGPFGFVLRNPEPLEFEPMRGQLGFFNYKGKK